MVRRGSIRVSRSKENARVDVCVDPEGSACVVVDRQDAADLAAILAAVGRPLYDEFGAGDDDDDADDDPGWPLAAHGPALHVGGASPRLYALSVRQVVRLAQQLEAFAYAPRKSD